MFKREKEKKVKKKKSEKEKKRKSEKEKKRTLWFCFWNHPLLFSP